MNRLESAFRRIPVVGRFWHLGSLVGAFGLATAPGMGIQRLVVFPLEWFVGRPLRSCTGEARWSRAANCSHTCWAGRRNRRAGETV